MTEREVLHQPVVTSLHGDGRWGVFCDACSHEAQDYVERCEARPEMPWPPPVLVAER